MLIDFLQQLFNLIIGLFVLRYAQMKITEKNPTSDLGSALAFLLH